jgi:hypothetical protein
MIVQIKNFSRKELIINQVNRLKRNKEMEKNNPLLMNLIKFLLHNKMKAKVDPALLQIK